MEKLLSSHTAPNGDKISLEVWSDSGNVFWRVGWKSTSFQSSTPYDDLREAEEAYKEAVKHSRRG